MDGLITIYHGFAKEFLLNYNRIPTLDEERIPVELSSSITTEFPHNYCGYPIQFQKNSCRITTDFTWNYHRFSRELFAKPAME